MELCDYFKDAKNIYVYNEGVKAEYSSGEKGYEDILACWNEMICGAHEMPAYGVSLNRETQEARNSGLWLEFDFVKKKTHNGMPFEKLLVNVEKQFSGFNLIRYDSIRGYDGRCFYYDLVGKNMGNLSVLLLNL